MWMSSSKASRFISLTVQRSQSVQFWCDSLSVHTTNDWWPDDVEPLPLDAWIIRSVRRIEPRAFAFGCIVFWMSPIVPGCFVSHRTWIARSKGAWQRRFSSMINNLQWNYANYYLTMVIRTNCVQTLTDLEEFHILRQRLLGWAVTLHWNSPLSTRGIKCPRWLMLVPLA